MDGIRRTRATGKSQHSPIQEQTTLHEEQELGKSKLVSEETEAKTGVQAVSVDTAYRNKGKSLGVVQVD